MNNKKHCGKSSVKKSTTVKTTSKSVMKATGSNMAKVPDRKPTPQPRGTAKKQ